MSEMDKMDEIKESIENVEDKNSNKRRGKLTDYVGIGAMIGIVIGAVAGYLYYYYIGCRSGSCPINSNPYFSTLWGALAGYLLGDMFRKKKPAIRS
jgi:MFS family permease